MSLYLATPYTRDSLYNVGAYTQRFRVYAGQLGYGDNPSSLELEWQENSKSQVRLVATPEDLRERFGYHLLCSVVYGNDVGGYLLVEGKGRDYTTWFSQRYFQARERLERLCREIGIEPDPLFLIDLTPY